MSGHLGPKLIVACRPLLFALAGASACAAPYESPSTTDGTGPTSDASADAGVSVGATGSSGEDVSNTISGSTGLPGSSSDPVTSSGSSSSNSTGAAEPECGDGVHDPVTEECDEGVNNSEHGACTGECLFNVCGDGNRHDGVEECDLGNANHDAACGGCTKSCTFGAYCGDDNLDAVCGELCDGADNPSPDGVECTDTCRFNAKLVFITPGLYNGDLTAYTERPVHDGVDAADWICHDLADAAGLVEPPAEDDDPETPRFRAWISAAGLDELGEPITLEDNFKTVEGRLHSDHTAPYVTRGGLVVAEGWSGLTSGQLLAPITATTEPDEHVYDASVWTNTRSDGTMNQSFLSCVDWTYDGEIGGAVGKSGSVTSWTFIAGAQGIKSCELPRSLYCIEQ